MTPLQRKFAQQNEPKEELTIEKTDTLRVTRRADGSVAEIAELKPHSFFAEPVRDGAYEKYDKYGRVSETGVSSIGFKVSSSKYYENGQKASSMRKVSQPPKQHGGGYASGRLVEQVQEYHVSGRPVSEKRRFPRFKKDVLIPVERTDYRGNEASYYGPENQLLARGPVDERRHATGFWHFPEETDKNWQVAFFHENRRIASGASIKALTESQPEVIEAMEKQGELPAPPSYEPF